MHPQCNAFLQLGGGGSLASDESTLEYRSDFLGLRSDLPDNSPQQGSLVPKKHHIPEVSDRDANTTTYEFTRGHHCE